LALGPRLFAELPIAGPCFAVLSMGGWVRELPAAGQARFTLGADGQLGVGARF
jgi:hypothetical protein